VAGRLAPGNESGNELFNFFSRETALRNGLQDFRGVVSIALYGEYFVGIVGIYFPLLYAIEFIEKWRDGADTTSAIDIGFEFECRHD